MPMFYLKLYILKIALKYLKKIIVKKNKPIKYDSLLLVKRS